MSPAPLSVVIPTRDRLEHLAACVASVRAALGPGDEVIVADSASHSPAVREVAERHGCTYIRCDLPGASRARNAGWRAATHEVVAFIDDDVRVDAGWADSIRRTMAEHPEVGWLTGRLDVPPDVYARRPVSVKDDDLGGPIDLQTRAVLGHSASMAARRTALVAVGGFDERMGPGADMISTEDRDLFDRLMAQGFGGWYDPGARGWHEQWRTEGQLMRLDWGYGFGSGARLAKLLRTDRRRARWAAREMLWRWGMRDVIRFGLDGNRFMATTSLVRVGGSIAGLLRSLPVPLRDGHFAPRRRAR